MKCVALCALLCVSLGAPVSNSTGTALKYYSDGLYVSVSLDALRQREERESARRGQLWRTSPAMVAAIETSEMRPVALGLDMPKWEIEPSGAVTVRTPAWQAEYSLTESNRDAATCVLSVNDLPAATISLRRPFGGWWYVVGLDRLARTGAGPGTKSGIQMLPMKLALQENGISVVWDATAGLALIKGRNVSARVRPGSKVVMVAESPVSVIAPAVVSSGVMLAPENLLSSVIALELLASGA